jgi:predicted RNA-binding Zn-ribbon protein involved in translation (DUF1610 family)
MKYKCENCGWIGDESELHTNFAEDIGTRSDEEVCPKCGAFEECRPFEEFNNYLAAADQFDALFAAITKDWRKSK